MAERGVDDRSAAAAQLAGGAMAQLGIRALVPVRAVRLLAGALGGLHSGQALARQVRAQAREARAL